MVRDRGGGDKVQAVGVKAENMFEDLIALFSLLKFLPKYLCKLKLCFGFWLTLSSHQQYYCSHYDNNIYVLLHSEQLAFEAPEEAVNFTTFFSGT